MILVTGATGFLGTELVLQLSQQGLKLRALKREHSKIPEILQDIDLIDWVVADINDLATLEEVFENLAHRDYADTTREESPLTRAEDAIVLDNTELTEAEQLDFALDMVHQHLP